MAMRYILLFTSYGKYDKVFQSLSVNTDMWSLICLIGIWLCYIEFYSLFRMIALKQLQEKYLLGLQRTFDKNHSLNTFIKHKGKDKIF